MIRRHKTSHDSIGFLDNGLYHCTNFDGIVDMTDLYILAQNWLTTDSFWYTGDFNYDGQVNAKDLGIIALNWQAGVDNPLAGEPLPKFAAALGLPVSALPEPSSTGILAILLIAAQRGRLVRHCKVRR